MNKTIKTGIFLSILLILVAVIPGVVQAQYYGCTSNYQERCMGNSLYWYDSCGNQQGVAQYCSGGCYNNSCQNNYNNNYNYNYNGNYNNYNNNNNYNNYGNCAYHAYKLCVGSNIYWYDSCGNQQDLYSSCYNGQVCNSPGQYGQCAIYIQPVQPPVQQYSSYVAHYKTACYAGSIFWYDSLGVVSGLYKNCTDSNSCTQDSCSGDKCLNTLKCDGSTCGIGSADYNTYCQPAQTIIPTPTPAQTSLPIQSATPSATPAVNMNASALSISFFAKQDQNSTQWQKSVQAGSNGQIYFMISLENNSTAQIDNVNVLANIPGQVSSVGNLQINGVMVSGDIISGINIGTISPASSKSITFEGKTQTISSASTQQATATSNVSGATQSDSLSINFVPSQAVAAAVSKTPATSNSGFGGFLARWYLWILVGLVLIFLFVIVYRRLSSNT